MTIYYIYKATNKANGKAYVGVSYRPVKRRQQHHCDAKPNKSDYTFHRAIRKFGKKAFEWEILDYTTNKAQAYIWLEKYWIRTFDTFHNGYNMTEGNNNLPGNKAKQTIIDGAVYTSRKAAAAALCVAESTIIKWVKQGKPLPMKGRKLEPFSDKHCENISRACKGRTPWNKGGIGPNAGAELPKKWKPLVIDGVMYPSRKAAKEHCGVDSTTIYRWIKNGKANDVCKD